MKDGGVLTRLKREGSTTIHAIQQVFKEKRISPP